MWAGGGWEGVAREGCPENQRMSRSWWGQGGGGGEGGRKHPVHNPGARGGAWAFEEQNLACVARGWRRGRRRLMVRLEKESRSVAKASPGSQKMQTSS